MSAGGLSYSGLVNHGRITLPSVDSWGTNMNILRDPPKSITTRRIEKVGDTNSMTDMIDDSGTRVCEAIQVYARGVNPFVSVSYNNYGNNGGQNSSGLRDGGMQSAKLPYTIMKDGAFRPPVLLQEDLLPLSRMPRGRTSAFSKAGFADFSRKMRSCGTAEDTKEVKTDTLKGCVRPTAVYQIETPLNKPFEVKYVIQPFIKRSVASGIRSMDITHKYGGKPTKEFDNNPLHARAQANFTDVRHVNNNQFYPERYLQDPLGHSVASNISSNKYSNLDNNELHPERYLQDPLGHSVASNISSNKYSNLDNNELHPERYLQDHLAHSVTSNISSNKHYTSIEDILDLADMPVHDDIRHFSIIAPVSGVEQTKYFHDDISLTRKLPEYNVTTNIGNQNVHKRLEYDNQIELSRNMPITSFVSNPISRGFTDHSSRDARLAEKIKPGGYSVPGQIPMHGRMQNVIETRESEKGRLGRMVMESMQGRFDKPAPFG